MTSIHGHDPSHLQIRVSEFVSLDGVVQAPGDPAEDPDGGFRHGGWSMPYFDEAVGAGAGAAMEGVSGLLFGRRTWEVMAQTWPDRAGDPFADTLNSLPKLVVSSTLSEPGWNTTVVDATTWAAELRRRRQQETGGVLLVMGSAQLVRGLIAEGLVDDLRLSIEPITLGGGKSIWPTDQSQRGWRLLASTLSGTGVHICRYAPEPTP